MSDDAIKTVAGEITKIAVEHGYNGTAPKTITGAIDALADTLAGSDVDSGQTVAQAVRALAPYIGSGGGGSLGALQAWPQFVINPIVGESMSFEGGAQAFKLMAGSTTLYEVDNDLYEVDKDDKEGYLGEPITGGFVAANVKMVVTGGSNIFEPGTDGSLLYAVKITDNEPFTWASVRPLGAIHESTTIRYYGGEYPAIIFMMPELTDGESLVIRVHS